MTAGTASGTPAPATWQAIQRSGGVNSPSPPPATTWNASVSGDSPVTARLDENTAALGSVERLLPPTQVVTDLPTRWERFGGSPWGDPASTDRFNVPTIASSVGGAVSYTHLRAHETDSYL